MTSGNFLSRIAGYQDENIVLHLQAQRELLLLLFAFNHQNYCSYLTCHQFELQALKRNNSFAYRKFKTCRMGASLTGGKHLAIPGD